MTPISSFGMKVEFEHHQHTAPYSPQGIEGDITGKNMEEKHAQERTLVNTDQMGKRTGEELVSTPISCAEYGHRGKMKTSLD